MLSGSLPIEVVRSNAEATKETGEGISPFAAGHSVWFEWVATGTEWVTVGICDAGFPAVLGVFTGTAIGDLTKVASGNSSEGPHCPFSEREYTFKAVSSTSYKIGLDGNVFSLPGGPKPVTEGSIPLRIEATPLPANDDFQNAATLKGETNEEPGGNRFHSASVLGFNWGATKEVGEPNHAEDPGGASVWYSWTAPESGVARISACCASSLLFGVYVGSSVDALVAVAPTPDTPVGTNFVVSAGTTYRIAVDGEFDTGEGTAKMGSFTVGVFMQLQPGRGQQDPPPTAQPVPLVPDTTPPNTAIRKSVLRRMPPIWVFRFKSTEAGSTLRCRLDKRPFAKCGFERRYAHLPPGRHILRVAAVDPSGNVDPSPAVTRFNFPDVKGQGKG